QAHAVAQCDRLAVDHRRIELPARDMEIEEAAHFLRQAIPTGELVLEGLALRAHQDRARHLDAGLCLRIGACRLLGRQRDRADRPQRAYQPPRTAITHVEPSPWLRLESSATAAARQVAVTDASNRSGAGLAREQFQLA